VLRPRRSFFSGVPFAHSTAATCVRKSREVEINSIGAESLEGCLRPGDGRCPLGHKRKYRWTNDANSFACLLSEMPTRHPARLRLRRVREIGHRGPRFTLRLLRDTKIKRRSTWRTGLRGYGKMGGRDWQTRSLCLPCPATRQQLASSQWLLDLDECRTDRICVKDGMNFRTVFHHCKREVQRHRTVRGVNHSCPSAIRIDSIGSARRYKSRL
jgi:hypothetical protein